MNWNRTAARAILLTVLATVLAGCASQRAFRMAEQSAKREDWDGAVIGYSKALGMDPGNDSYLAALMRAKLRASAVHFERGKRYLLAEQLELAITEFEQTTFLDPANMYAQTELDKAREKLARLQATPSQIEEAKKAAKKHSLAPPRLSPSSNQPIVLKFKEQPVQKIYEAISKTVGINFLYDDKVDLNKKQSIDLAGLTFERAMDILMLQFKHFYKVIDENTLLIADDNQQKRREYEDKVIRTFFLSSGDTKQVNTLLRSLLDVRKVAENAQLNSITIRDNPDVVAVAEKIIDNNDKAKAELIIDIELLEVNRTTVQNLGLDLSDKAFSLNFLGGKASLPLNALRKVRKQGSWSFGPIPGAVLNFLRADSDTKTISKPQLRVTEGEKAELHIGDRVPIPTTTFNTSQTVGGNIVPVTSFTYQNTGIQLTIEPRVHHNKEVTLKLNVEVSSVGANLQGTQQPTIGTRQIQTVVRLKDGETNLLSGLIREDDSKSLTGVPILSSIPGLRRLFGNENDTKTVLDIVLTITPHIVRVPDISEEDLEAIWVGTEENTRLRVPAKNAFGETPFSVPDEEPAGTAPGVAVPPGTATPAVPSPAAERQAPILPSVPAAPAGRSPVLSPLQPGPETKKPPIVEPDEPPDDEFYDEGDDEEGDATPAPPSAEDHKTPSPVTSIAQVIVVAPRSAYHVGELVTIQVQIVGAQNVGSVPFHLRYNPQVFTFIPPAGEGDFLASDGTPTVFVATEVQGGGEIVVGLSRVGSGSGASGQGILATFQFQAKAPGSGTFSFTGSSVRDPSAASLPSSFTTAAVNVQPN